MPSREDFGDLIKELYAGLLDRQAEPNELEEWLAHADGGMPAAELFRQIYGSPEARRKKDERNGKDESGSRLGAEDDRHFVTSAYEAILSRTPDPADIEACLLVLRNGTSAAQFMGELKNSEEASNVRATRQQVLRDQCFDLCTQTISKALGRDAPVTFGNGHADIADLASVGARVAEWLSSEHGAKLVDDFQAAHVSRLVEQKELTRGDNTLSDDARRRVVAALYLGVFGRIAEVQEIDTWATHLANGMEVQELVDLLVGSDEGRFLRALAGLAQSPEQFVQLVGRIVAGEAYTSHEIADRIEYMRRHGHTPLRFLVDQFGAAVRHLQAPPAPPQKLDILGNLYMVGSNKPFDMRVWFDDERHAATGRPQRKTRPNRRRDPGTVTAVASVYKGDKYIEAFLENMVNQTIFDQSVTLIIVDAASPQNEAEIIEKYTKEHKNIIYTRTDTRIGIYDAWNQGIKQTKSDYITNVNLDDLRREDSLEIQRDMLDDLEFADVVYQDFYYSLDSNISYAEIERRNVRCRLPHITLTNLVHFNSPHNGPMWRRRLHDELGYYNDEYRSAGDCDFWIRCCVAGKVFVKSNEPHVGYYVNPQGLSTHGETLGFTEHAKIKRHLGASLVHDAFVEEKHLFAKRVGVSPEMIGERARYDVVANRMLALAQDA